MGLDKGLCDSCGEVFDVLFPVGILDECPTGGMKHVQKWYCVSCRDTIEEEAETNNNDEDTKENEESFLNGEVREVFTKNTVKNDLSFEEWYLGIPKKPWHYRKEE